MARIAHFCQSSLLWILCLVPMTGHLLLVHAYSQSEGAAAQRQMGLAYLQNGQLRNALEAYRRALEIDPLSEIIYLETADIYLTARLPDDAESVLAQAAQRFPDSDSPNYNLLHHDLAELWASTGRLGKASESMQAASRVHGPVRAEIIYKRIGDFNTDLLRLDSALIAYRAALELEPDNIATRLALGNLHLRRNSLDEALMTFKQVLTSIPANVSALHGIAEVHRRRGEFEEAILASNGVLERAPTHQGALYIRGMVQVRLGLRDQGQRDLDAYRNLQIAAQAKEERLRDINTYRTGGMDLVLQGQYYEAIALFATGIQSYPDAEDLYLNLGQAQGEDGRHRDAIETFLSMLEVIGEQAAAAHENLAREYRIVGDIEASERHLALYEASLSNAN